MQAEARILVGADSAVLWASSAALEILDMTLEELQGLPPGALSVDPDPEAAGRFRAAWAELGGSTVFARGTVRLLSGKLIRLRIYATPLPDGNIDLLLEPSSESTEEPPQTYTVGSVLSEWRAAERQARRRRRRQPRLERRAGRDRALPHRLQEGRARKGRRRTRQRVIDAALARCRREKVAQTTVDLTPRA